MPYINGLDLFYKFRKMNPKIKAFIHSGGNIPELSKDIKGLYGFIKKLYNKDKLKEILIKMEFKI